MTEPERENRADDHKLTLLGCGSCGTNWLSRAGRLLLEHRARCLRCDGALEAAESAADDD